MKVQKRPATQAPKGEVVKTNLTLGVEQHRRLFISAIMSGKTASAIVDDLIKQGLRDWSMPANLSVRATRAVHSQSVDPAAHGEVPMADLAA